MECSRITWPVDLGIFLRFLVIFAPELLCQEVLVLPCPREERLGLGMPNSGIPYMSLTLFLFIPSTLFPFSHLPLLLTCLNLPFNVSSVPFSHSDALPPFSHLSHRSPCSHLLPPTLRLVSLPDHLELKRCHSCLAADCLWSSFPLRSADGAAARKIP